MIRAEKAARIQAILDQLYPDVPIPLAHRDPFTLLVAVVLSAQCTDARVNLVTPRLFARAPTAAAMAKLSQRQILSLIRSCGLAPAKSKALKALSRILIERHGGAVPSDMAALEELPGVGHKTASVVLSQAFGQPAFPVDTHIHRLAARWGLSDGSSVARTERDLKRTFPPDTWNKLHLQIIYFGRQYCPARGHQPSECPICSWAASKTRLARPARPRRRSRRAGAAPALRRARRGARRRPGGPCS
jgi:endonuclease-3